MGLEDGNQPVNNFTLYFLVIFVILAIIVLFVFFWKNNTTQTNTPPDLSLNRKMHEIMVNESLLQHNLMIETLNGASEKAQSCTVSNINNCAAKIVEYLDPVCGLKNSRQITNLLRQRNDCIRKYYQLLRNVICPGGRCVYNLDLSSQVVIQDIGTLDETNQTLATLQRLSDELIKHLPEGSNYDKFRDLLNIYNEDLILCAKLYMGNNYEISGDKWAEIRQLTFMLAEEYGRIINNASKNSKNRRSKR